MKTSIAKYHVLRSAYENAFRRLTVESGAFRDLAVGAGDELTHIEHARKRVERATAIYRHRRDTLTDFLLHKRQY